MSILKNKYDLKTRDYLFVFDDKVILRHCQNQQFDNELHLKDIEKIVFQYPSLGKSGFIHFIVKDEDEKTKANNTVYASFNMVNVATDSIQQEFPNIKVELANAETSTTIGTAKPKKAKDWRKIVIALIAILLVVSFLPDTVNKEEALAYDAKLWNLLEVADENYLTLTTGLTSENMSAIDLYDLCKLTKSKQDKVIDFIYDIEFNSNIIDDYKKSALDFIGVTKLVADSAMDYLDENKVSDLSDLTTRNEEVPKYADILNGARIEFLTNAGATAEEIVNILGLSAE